MAMTYMTMRRSILLAGFIFLCNAYLNSQAVYMNTEWDIFRITGDMGNSNRVVIDNGCGPDSSVLSIAVHKDTMYYNTWDGKLKRFKIGKPGSCEILLEDGFTYNSMTIDKNGLIYVAADNLVRYNPYTGELVDLGLMSFVSAGDMLFFKDKLLLAGWDMTDWTTGIYELNTENPAASKLYMETPNFFGLLSLPVACGSSRYFGLYPTEGKTKLVELDLADKTVIGETDSIPERIMDAASITETGVDNKVSFADISKAHPNNCASNNGSVFLTAQSLHMPLTFTLLNSSISQPSGKFDNLKGGTYEFRVTDTLGCTADTSIVLAEGAPLPSCGELFIPNAFTPNNDGKNDYFSFTAPAHYKNIQLQIFGRWGNLVYAAKTNTIAWDGSSRGAKQPTGVYIYTLTWTGPSGDQQSLKGPLTLIR